MNVILKPEILTTLRKNRHIPIEVIADKLKISTEEYKNYESSETEVSLKDAEKIAKIYNRNWTVFLLDKAPEAPNFNQDHRTEKNQKTAIGYKTYNALEESDYLLDFIVNVSEDKTNKIPRFDGPIAPAAMATKFREVIGLPYDKQAKQPSTAAAIKFWVNKFGDLGINVSSYELGEGDKVRAFSIFEQHKAIIVLNSDESDNGKLFSLMHELAHILIRNTGVCDLQRVDIEDYCNKFASEMLIPADVFKQLVADMSVTDQNAETCSDELSKKLRVSRLAVLTRLLQGKFISPRKYDELSAAEFQKFSMYRIQKKRRQAENKNPMINPYTVRRARLGNLFLGEILNAYHHARISPFEASNYLGFKVQTIGKFNDWVGRHES